MALQEEKAQGEMTYWRTVQAREGTLRNGWYEYFFTTHFGLTRDFYRAKNVLDIGCGPRGSLEWANIAAERIGLDPLADLYRELGTDRHDMRYVAMPSENIPFADRHFDVVSSFNSLDHVNDLDKTVSEILRVVTPGGLFLLLTDVNHKPTLCEPVTYSWDIVDRFLSGLTLVESRRYEKKAGGMYESIKQGLSYDDADKKERYGILSALFTRRD